MQTGSSIFNNPSPTRIIIMLYSRQRRSLFFVKCHDCTSPCPLYTKDCCSLELCQEPHGFTHQLAVQCSIFVRCFFPSARVVCNMIFSWSSKSLLKNGWVNQRTCIFVYETTSANPVLVSTASINSNRRFSEWPKNNPVILITCVNVNVLFTALSKSWTPCPKG